MQHSRTSKSSTQINVPSKQLSHPHASAVPQVSSCGHKSKLWRKPRCHVALSLMCRIVVERRGDCPIELQWPTLSLNVKATLCRRPANRHAERVSVSLVTPVYLASNATKQTADETLHRLAKWITRWVPEIDGGRIHVHAYNKGDFVQHALEQQHAHLIANGRLELTKWNFFEAMNMQLRSTHASAGSTPSEGLNANHPHFWVLTKSLLELRGRTEWLVLVDIDEFWTTPPQSNAPLRTIAGFLNALPLSVQQHAFCTVDTCSLDGVDGVVRWRPKSALRIGRGACEWWGHPHAGVTVERFDDSVSCSSLDREGKRVDVFAIAPGHTWSIFDPLCREKLRMPTSYIAHERPGRPACAPEWQSVMRGPAVEPAVT